MSKRVRRGGCLESWMVDEDVAACQAIDAMTGETGRDAAAPRMVRPVFADVRPAEASPGGVDEKSRV